MEYEEPARIFSHRKKFKYGVMWLTFSAVCLALWLMVFWFGNTIARRSYHVTGENYDIVLLILSVLTQLSLCVKLLIFACIAAVKFHKVLCRCYGEPQLKRKSCALRAFSICMAVASVLLAVLPFCFHGFYNFFLMRR